MHKIFGLFLLSWASSSSLVFAQATVGTTPPHIDIDGDDGGRVRGGKWSSAELKDKVHVLFYVDPDEKTTNDPASLALKKADLPPEKFGSFAVINMAATWIPNALIDKSLQDKQAEFPRTTYVKDLRKVLVKKWGLDDNASVVLLFDKSGKLLFHQSGALSPTEIEQLVDLVRKNL